jgi:hypothetical protein
MDPTVGGGVDGATALGGGWPNQITMKMSSAATIRTRRIKRLELVSAMPDDSRLVGSCHFDGASLMDSGRARLAPDSFPGQLPPGTYPRALLASNRVTGDNSVVHTVSSIATRPVTRGSVGRNE